MTSLDGKIMGTYMDTPEGAAAGEVFYDIAFGKDAFYKHEGWIYGRVTTDDNRSTRNLIWTRTRRRFLSGSSSLWRNVRCTTSPLTGAGGALWVRYQVMNAKE